MSRTICTKCALPGCHSSMHEPPIADGMRPIGWGYPQRESSTWAKYMPGPNPHVFLQGSSSSSLSSSSLSTVAPREQ